MSSGEKGTNFEWSSPCFASMAGQTEEGKENVCFLHSSSQNSPTKYFNCIVQLEDDGITITFSFLPSIVLCNYLPSVLCMQETLPVFSNDIPIRAHKIKPGGNLQMPFVSLADNHTCLLSFSLEGEISEQLSNLNGI